MDNELNRKIYVIGVVSTIVLLYILGIKYILPLIWPVIIGFVLAKIISPIVFILKKYLKLADGFASAVVLTIVVGIICGLLAFAVVWLYRCIGEIIKNRQQYGDVAYRYICDACYGIEETFGVQRGNLSKTIIKYCNNKMEKMASGFMGNYGGMAIIKLMADILIAFAIIYVCAVLMAKDMEKIKENLKNNKWCSEIIELYHEIKGVIVTYIKAQFVIMLVTALICTLTLLIIGEDNPVVLGIGIGILDAFPMIGVGIILIPWSIIKLISGKYVAAILLVTAFIICTVLREWLEPKLIGDKIGMHPLSILASLYAGYKLFGITGFIFGPVGFVVVKAVVKMFLNKKEQQVY